MSEMVERVTKAIWEAECGPIIDGDTQGWQQMVARAAIAAMRDPTPAMVDAADPHGLIRANFEDAWRAMVDEALK